MTYQEYDWVSKRMWEIDYSKTEVTAYQVFWMYVDMYGAIF